jgi:hypothetical protein
MIEQRPPAEVEVVTHNLFAAAPLIEAIKDDRDPSQE